MSCGFWDALSMVGVSCNVPTIGAIWTKQTATSSNVELAGSSSLASMLYTSNSNLQFTDDTGATWSATGASGTDQQPSVSADGGRMTIINQSGSYRQGFLRNGGGWSNCTSSYTTNNINVLKICGSKLFASGFDNFFDEKTIESTDWGVSWSVITNITLTTVNTVYSDYSGTTLIARLAGNASHGISLNSGSSYSSITTPVANDALDKYAISGNGSIVYLKAATDNKLYKSIDNCASFADININLPADIVAGTPACSNDGSVVMADAFNTATGKYGIAVSADEGDSFVFITALSITGLDTATIQVPICDSTGYKIALAVYGGAAAGIYYSAE